MRGSSPCQSEMVSFLTTRRIRASQSITIRVSTGCLPQGLPDGLAKAYRDSIADLFILPTDASFEKPLSGKLLETCVLSDR
jgi:hypothetical protein